MAEIISTSLSWEQEDAQKYFLEPLFVNNDDLAFFEVITNVSGASYKLDRFGSLEKFTLADSGAAFTTGSAASASTYAQTTVNLTRLKAEAYASAYTFYNTVKSQLLKQGLGRDDMSGTLLQQIISEVFIKGLKRDMSSQSWLAYTKQADDSTANTDTHFNVYDGLWSQLEGGTGVTNVAVQNSSAVADNGAIAAGVALSTFAAMVAGASDELLGEKQDAVIFCSRAMADNYKASLQAANTHVSSYTALIDGVQRLTYDGIPLIVKGDWDVHQGASASHNSNGCTSLNKASSTALMKANKSAAVLTIKNNLVVCTDFEAQDVELWYNQDERQNRFRMSYSIGVGYKDAKYVVVATQS
tara:strand:- start:2499 stop:3569 length:1071 start_codon:yes stop_codon:yes gene_type:complete